MYVPLAADGLIFTRCSSNASMFSFRSSTGKANLAHPQVNVAAVVVPVLHLAGGIVLHRSPPRQASPCPPSARASCPAGRAPARACLLCPSSADGQWPRQSPSSLLSRSSRPTHPRRLRPPRRSWPARPASPSQNAITRWVCPVPFGNEIDPRSIWSACLGSIPRCTTISTVWSTCPCAPCRSCSSGRRGCRPSS